MVSAAVEALAISNEFMGHTAVLLCDVNNVTSIGKASKIIKASGLRFGGWIFVEWCEGGRRGTVIVAPPNSADHIYYLGCLGRMAAMGAIRLGDSAEDAQLSMSTFDNPCGIHPAFSVPDSPFFRWYRGLTPTPSGWVSSQGGRVVLVTASDRDPLTC